MLDFHITSNNFFVNNAKNLSSRVKVQELDLDDPIRNVLELVVIIAGMFIGRFSRKLKTATSIYGICIPPLRSLKT